MRILYISNTISVSGAPAALVNLISGLKDRHEIAVVLPGKDGPLHDRLVSMGVKCFSDMPYGLTIWPRVLNPVKFVRRMYVLLLGNRKVSEYIGKVIDEFRPDIVHTNVGPLDLALRQCVERGIPHVWHIREFQQGMTFWPSRKSFMRALRTGGNWNVAITECVADHWGIRDCSQIIYDGVRVDVSRTDFADMEREDYFLFVGRMEKNKGLLELLKAFRMYRRSGGTAVLTVVGAASLMYGARCRAYVRMAGLQDCVSFIGRRDDVMSLMKKAKAVVVPSLTEGFGLVSVEAMLSGCIVIGNDTTGTKEQFDKGVRVTGEEIGLRYTGINQLYERLKEVSSSDADFASMRAAAIRTVMAEYDLNDKVREVEDYYRKILEGVI